MQVVDRPNKDAVSKAIDLYRDAMRDFIMRQLRPIRGRTIEELIGDALNNSDADALKETIADGKSVKDFIDTFHFPHIISRYWSDPFHEFFKGNRNIQSLAYLAHEMRNNISHIGATDLNDNETMAALLNIIDILERIKAPTPKEKVETLRQGIMIEALRQMKQRQKPVVSYPLTREEQAWKDAQSRMRRLHAKRPALHLARENGAWKSAQNEMIARQNRLALRELRARASGCQLCPLHETRNHVVFGEGNPNADLMFIGLAPGSAEDEGGRPFAGQAGQKLTEIIEAMNLKREDMYICDMVKCRTLESRRPESSEMKRCRPYLHRQIELIRPRVVVLLGETATRSLLESSRPLSALRGEFHEYPFNSGIKMIPTHHPASLLRNRGLGGDVWEDMQTVMQLLEQE